MIRKRKKRKIKKILLTVCAVILLAALCLSGFNILQGTNPFSDFAAWLRGRMAPVYSINGVIINGITEETRLITASAETECAIEIYDRRFDNVPLLGRFFAKAQKITFIGEALFTIDLGQLTEDDIKSDEISEQVIIYVPAPQFSHVYLDTDKIGIEKTRNGWLRWGEITFTAGEFAKLESHVINIMTENLNNNEEITAVLNANAKTAVKELIQKILSLPDPAEPGGGFENYKVTVEWLE